MRGRSFKIVFRGCVVKKGGGDRIALGKRQATQIGPIRLADYLQTPTFSPSLVKFPFSARILPIVSLFSLFYSSVTGIWGPDSRVLLTSPPSLIRPSPFINKYMSTTSVSSSYPIMYVSRQEMPCESIQRTLASATRFAMFRSNVLSN